MIPLISPFIRGTSNINTRCLRSSGVMGHCAYTCDSTREEVLAMDWNQCGCNETLSNKTHLLIIGRGLFADEDTKESKYLWRLCTAVNMHDYQSDRHIGSRHRQIR